MSLGACVVERHFTLDRRMEGPDHAASLEFKFQQLITGIREIEQSLGDGRERELSQGEMINRENLAKSLVAAKPLKKELFCKLRTFRFGVLVKDFHPNLEELLGRTPARFGYRVFYPADLQDERVEPRSYQFNGPGGFQFHHDFQNTNNAYPQTYLSSTFSTRTWTSILLII